MEFDSFLQSFSLKDNLSMTTTRQYANDLRADLTTPKGQRVSPALTRGNHVCIYSDGYLLRGVTYHFRAHVTLTPTGWRLANSTDLYVSRHPVPSPEVSNAAKSAIAEDVTVCWTQYITAHPELLRQAQVGYLNNEIITKQEDKETLLEQLAAKNKEIADLEEQERKEFGWGY